MLSFLKQFFRFLGLEVTILNIRKKPRYELAQLLEILKVTLVFDIGANIGQFGSEIRKVGYKGKIVSFEPLTNEHAILQKTAINDQLWQIHSQCAIGNYDGEVDINISGNSVSSSILPMSDLHVNAAKESSYVSKIKVPIRKLDSVGIPYVKEGSTFFLKIDTQGYEWQVLEGASFIVKQASGVQIELSLVQLYEGQPNWMDVIKKMESLGFKLWKLHPGFTDPNNGQLLQCDATFIRSNISVA